MKLEVRADGLHISGYVNATMRESRPVYISIGKVIEVIEERAFERALEKTSNVPMYLDHRPDRVLANTNDNTLSLREDSIGLRAETVITDEETINAAKQGKLKGWSFGMKKITDTIEERAGKLPLRHINGFVLDHVSLIMNKMPFYSATSIELRADNEEEEMEIRAIDDVDSFNALLPADDTVATPEKKEPINYSKHENRILEIKVGL